MAEGSVPGYFWEDPGFIRKIESARLVLKNRARGVRFGENRSKYYGRGIEISHLTNYSDGEDVKFIDWNASMRLGRTFLKVFSSPRENNIYVMVDRSRSMEFGSPVTKEGTALRVAYAISYLALAGFNKVVVMDFAERVATARDVSRAGINQRFRELVSSRPASGGTAVDRAVADLFAAGRRRGLLFLISDFVDPGLSVLESVARIALSHNFCAVHVSSREDFEFPATGEFKFEDSETGEPVEVSMTPEIAAACAAEWRGYCADLAARCRKYGGFYGSITAGDDPVALLRDISSVPGMA